MLKNADGLSESMRLRRKPTTWSIAVAGALIILTAMSIFCRQARSYESRFSSSVDTKSSNTSFGREESDAFIENHKRLSNYQFYTLRNHSQYVSNSKVGGVDAVMAAHYAHRLCNSLFDMGHDISSSIASSDYRSNSDRRKSAKYLEVFRRKTCAKGTEFSVSKLYDEYQNELLDAAERTLDKDYILTIDIQTRLLDSDALHIRDIQSLSKIVERTDSPVTFIEAAGLLASYGGSDWNIGNDYVYGAAQADTLLTVRQGGIALAYCQIYNVCQPDSIVSVASCFPYDCAQGISFNDIIRSNMTPRQYHIAIRIAKDIVNSRQE